MLGRIPKRGRVAVLLTIPLVAALCSVSLVFACTSLARLAVTPAEGLAGTSATATGTAFAGQQNMVSATSVDLRFRSSPAGTDIDLGTVQPDSKGNIALTFAVPHVTPGNNYYVSAIPYVGANAMSGGAPNANYGFIVDAPQPPSGPNPPPAGPGPGPAGPAPAAAGQPSTLPPAQGSAGTAGPAVAAPVEAVPANAAAAAGAARRGFVEGIDISPGQPLGPQTASPRPQPGRTGSVALPVAALAAIIAAGTLLLIVGAGTAAATVRARHRRVAARRSAD